MERCIKVEEVGGRRERQDRRKSRGKLCTSDRLTAVAAIYLQSRSRAKSSSSNDDGAAKSAGGGRRRREREFTLSRRRTV